MEEVKIFGRLGYQKSPEKIGPKIAPPIGSRLHRPAFFFIFRDFYVLTFLVSGRVVTSLLDTNISPPVLVLLEVDDVPNFPTSY